MDWKQALTEGQTHSEDYVGRQKEPAEGFFALHRATLDPGALDTRQKELMALAIGISKQCVDCIGFHTKAAMEAGATRAEIEETVSVCIMMGGGPALMYGTKALEAFDQLHG
ncbi:alkylhydroperoxidase AhpD family core domain-containing protein [Rhodovulum sp. ES.010]|uniref:carboxymuconolactone decarboxylase family protein n=1 Tax=Rhodovulum sp. ES.010 TaxID=1882821 RepID=UPI0009281391|nr:carboxymuconolactone decarboxylase family protein [Rhodovulum sp. ES.010]SIO11296.1 alkylhydroperoxidase AhpD family core domain-containing protein [Rhodovulum sp. ES.010]